MPKDLVFNLWEKRPSRFPMMLDSAWAVGYADDRQGPPASSTTEPTTWPFYIDRHYGHVNSLFMDWSVRKVRLKELWQLKWHPKFNTANAWATGDR